VREDTGNAISVETVLVLWRSALATPLHGPFCACCGGIPVSPADLEQDVLDYLVQRYEQRADPLLAEAVRQRLSTTARSLTDWLTALTRELPPAASQQILDDLANVLRGIAADRPGSFVCT
jgi:hypothetical protein